MSKITRAIVLVTFSIGLSEALAEEPLRRSVTLPLADYLALVERVSQAEEAVRLAGAQREPDVVELTSQQASIVWPDEASDFVDVVSRFEVLVQGERFEPVTLPLTGLAASVVIEPATGASIHAGAKGLELTPSDPGRYRITVTGRAPIEESLGTRSLVVAPNLAAVAALELDLPASLRWEAPGAVVSSESIGGDARRVVGFTLPKGAGTSLRVRRDVEGDEAERMLADVAMATLIELHDDGILRHDVVGFRVSRGTLRRHRLTLPEGMSLTRLVTDEGDAPLLIEDGVLTVDRKRRLEDEGYIVVTSQPDEATKIPLDALETTLPVRERLLMIASSVVAEVEPAPRSSFRRVDVSDVPAFLRDALGLGAHAAWRVVESPRGATLRVAPKPSAETLPTVVRERRSLTLLTTEGSLVHRDTLTLQTTATTFELTLPEGATLWSSRVNETFVRVVERDGRIIVPLGFASEGEEVVELVSISKLPVPDRRALLGLALPEIGHPVLHHDWRILVPKQNEYRYRSGSLRPTVTSRPPEREAAARSSALGLGPGGLSGMRVRAYDEQGLVLPGVSVTLTSRDSGRDLVAVTNVEGQVWFPSLPSGYYGLEAALAGFQSAIYESFYLEPGETPAYRVTMGLSSVAETITVTGRSPLIDTRSAGVTTRFGSRGGSPSTRGGTRAPKSKVTYDELLAFRGEAADLRAGLTSGVKPVPVHIPEQGKLLVLSGALPPAEVAVLLDVRPD